MILIIHFLFAFIFIALFVSFNAEMKAKRNAEGTKTSYSKSFFECNQNEGETAAGIIFALFFVWEIFIPFAILVFLLRKVIAQVLSNQKGDSK